MSIRMLLYRACGMSVGNGARINPKCFFSTSNVVIGNGVFVNRFCQIHDGLKGGGLIVGDNVFIGFNCVFCLISHKVGDTKQRAGMRVKGNISVGRGAWIGANALILPNVKIGEGCVIAAGSVVTKDTEDNCLYAGCPARLIKKMNTNNQ